MTYHKTIPILLICLFLITACTSFPLSMTKDEWYNLSIEQKYNARLKQAELDEKSAQRQAVLRAKELTEARKAEEDRNSYIQGIYHRARYGDIIQCIIRKPVVDFHPGWDDALPVSFTLAKQEIKKISFKGIKRGKLAHVWAKFSNDGSSITLCSKPKRGQCDTMISLITDLRHGFSDNIDMPNILQGKLECALVP